MVEWTTCAALVVAASVIGAVAGQVAAAIVRTLRGPRHEHHWRWTNATPYDSITGPRTIVSMRCGECGDTSTWTRRGDWTLEQLNAE